MNLIKRLIAAFFPKKPDAKPVKFAEANFTYTTPHGMTKEQCGDLPCFRSETHAISCWQFPLRDRLRFLFTGRMWLYLLMSGHPPVCLMADTPFAKPEKPKPVRSMSWKLMIAGGVLIGLLIAIAGAKIQISIG